MNLSLSFPEPRRTDVQASVARFEAWMAVPDSPVHAVHREAARGGEFSDIPDTVHAELRRMGCSSFLLDLRQAPRENWNEIIVAFKANKGIPGTTEFNYATELI